MAFALVAHAYTYDSGTTSAIDTTGADLIVVYVNRYTSVGAPTLSDSKGNSWTALTETQDGTGLSSSRIYYCYAPTVGTGHTFTLTGGSGQAGCGVSAWSGAASSPFDAQNGGSKGGSSATVQPGSITPSQDDCLIVSGAGSFNEAYSSVDSGFTFLDSWPRSNGYPGAHGYKIQTSAAAINPTWTFASASVYGTAVIASFKSASAPAAAVKLLTLLGVG